MHRSFFLRGKQAGRFDDHLHPEVLPWQLRGVAFGDYFDRLAIDSNASAFGADILNEGAMNRIVLQQMSEGRGAGDVVDGHDLERILVMEGGAEKHSANPAETIDSYPNRHLSGPPLLAHEVPDKVNNL